MFTPCNAPPASSVLKANAPSSASIHRPTPPGTTPHTGRDSENAAPIRRHVSPQARAPKRWSRLEFRPRFEKHRAPRSDPGSPRELPTQSSNKMNQPKNKTTQKKKK